jgi:hypothetical protein
MAARRLIMILLVLLFISSIAAALVPIDRSGDSESSSTTTTRAAASEPRGRSLTKQLDTGGAKQTIRMRLGDELTLTVEGHAPDQVEIPRLDLVEPIDRGSPAQFFNLLPDITGTLKVRLIEANRTVGHIVVSAPKPQPKDKRESDRRRANESGRRA